MEVIFLEYAKFELDDAVCFYELRYEGLGQRFKKEVQTAV